MSEPAWKSTFGKKTPSRGKRAARRPRAFSRHRGDLVESSLRSTPREPTMHAEDFHSPPIAGLRADLALALRAAAHHGLAEGICNHFSVELPDGSDRFLLNPRGLLWSETQADDIVLIANDGRKL